MKFKKYSYLLVFILMLLVGINDVYAKEKKACFYLNEEENYKIKLDIYYDLWWAGNEGHATANPDSNFNVDWGAIMNVVGDFFGGKFTSASIMETFGRNGRDVEISNWLNRIETNSGVVMEMINRSYSEADSYPSCPQFIVAEYSNKFSLYATNDKNKAIEAVDKGTIDTAYLDNVDMETYMGAMKNDDPIDPDDPCDKEALFGLANDDGKTNDPNGDGQASIRYYIDTVLSYVRIIVPILIILLGIIDFAKAVLAGKEDEMKKSQRDFARRVIAGVVVFFVPLLINIVMDVTEDVWKSTDWACPENITEENSETTQ